MPLTTTSPKRLPAITKQCLEAILDFPFGTNLRAAEIVEYVERTTKIPAHLLEARDPAGKMRDIRHSLYYLLVREGYTLTSLGRYLEKKPEIIRDGAQRMQKLLEGYDRENPPPKLYDPEELQQELHSDTRTPVSKIRRMLPPDSSRLFQALEQIKQAGYNDHPRTALERLSEALGLQPGDIFQERRFKPLTVLRAAFWSTLYQGYGLSLLQIGKITGHDHTTVLNGIRSFEEYYARQSTTENCN